MEVGQVHPQETFPVFRRRALMAAVVPLVLIGLMWSVFWLDSVFDLGLRRYSLLPRDLFGALGILTAPLLHADLEHLFNNSVPMFVLGWCLFYFYPRAAWPALAAAWLVTGAMVWLSARADHHLGASGVVYALAAFVFLSGLLRRLRPLVALSLLMVFLYGGMVWGVLPIEQRISWESHLWGGVTGFAVAWLLRRTPSAVPPPPVYFADEEDQDDEPLPSGSDLGDEDDEAARLWKQRLAAEANRSTTLGTDDVHVRYPWD